MAKFAINKISLSEKTSSFTGQTDYVAEVNFDIDTSTTFNQKSGVFDNPKLDLSKNNISAIVVYSKKDLDLVDIKKLVGEKKAVRTRGLQENTIVQIERLSAIVRDKNGEIIKDLFVNYDYAQTVKNLENPPEAPLSTQIRYSFSFKRDLEELYKPNEVKNLHIIVVPIIYESVDDKPPKILNYYPLKKTQVIENDIFVGDNEDLRNKFYENLFSFSLSETDINNKTMSSDLFASFGKNSEVKGMFGIDKLNILRNMSLFGSLLQNVGIKEEDKRDISFLSQVLDLKIKRQKIKKLLGFAVREEKIFENFLEETIVSTREEPGTNELSRAQNIRRQSDFVIGEIGELDLDLSQGIKFVGFNDYDTSQEGLYKYSLDMSIKDGTKIFIEQRISILQDSLTQLKKYYGEKFINKVEVSPLMGENPAKRIAKVVMVLNDDAATLGSAFENSLLNLIKYQESTLNLIEFTNDLLKKLQDLDGINTNQVNISKSKNTSKINADKSVLYYSKTFSDYVDFNALKNINYDFMGIPANDQVGISVISNRDTKKRFSFEFFTKVIDSEQFDTFDNLQRKIYADTFGKSIANAGLVTNALSSEQKYFDLSQAYFGYLSPIQIRDEVISEENAFDPLVYNELHYQEIEDTDEAKKELLYEIMSGFGISVSEVFYRSIYRGTKSTSRLLARTPRFKNYDGKTDNTSNYIPLVNSILQKEENWNVSKESYSTTRLKRNFGDTMPNHMRVLFGGKSDAIGPTKWLSTSGDYFKNPNTYYMIKQNFMNLVEVEALVFNNDSDGNIDLKNVSFGLLDDLDVNSGTRVMCKTQPFQLSDASVENVSYPDKYFIIEAGTATGDSIEESILGTQTTTLGDLVSNSKINSRKKPASRAPSVSKGFIAQEVTGDITKGRKK